MDGNVINLIRKTDPKIHTLISKIEETETVNELRFRKNRRLAVTSGDENRTLGYTVSESVMNSLFEELCRGSVYAHGETIKNGYIMLPAGVRAGVCGRAVTEGNKIKNVYDIDSINIRLPRQITGICGRLFELIRQSGFYLNMLIYSVPGGGKTTMIRDLAYELANTGNRRVSVIDSRCEIADQRLKTSDNTDIFSNYPKSEAIEIATRTQNPQYIICDEIGSYEECLSLLSVQNAGVPVVATAHAASVSEIVRRKNISLLLENGFFDIFAGLKRSGNKLSISVCRADEVVKR